MKIKAVALAIVLSAFAMSLYGCCSPYYVSAKNEQALVDAVELRDHRAAERLLKQGVSANCEGDPQGVPVLHRAAYLNDLKMVELLLSYGADANKRDTFGDLPIDLAKDERVDALLRRKAKGQ